MKINRLFSIVFILASICLLISATPTLAQQKAVDLKSVATPVAEADAKHQRVQAVKLARQFNFSNNGAQSLANQSSGQPTQVHEAPGVITVFQEGSAMGDRRVVNYVAQRLRKGTFIMPQVNFSRGPLPLQSYFLNEDQDFIYLNLWDGNFRQLQPGGLSFQVTLFEPDGSMAVLFAPLGSGFGELNQFQFINSARQTGDLLVIDNRGLAPGSLEIALDNNMLLPMPFGVSGPNELVVPLPGQPFIQWLPEGNVTVTVKNAFLCDSVTFRYRRVAPSTGN